MLNAGTKFKLKSILVMGFLTRWMQGLGDCYVEFLLYDVKWSILWDSDCVA